MTVNLTVPLYCTLATLFPVLDKPRPTCLSPIQVGKLLYTPPLQSQQPHRITYTPSTHMTHPPKKHITVSQRAWSHLHQPHARTGRGN